MNKLYQRARKNKQQAINFAFIIFTHVATNYFKRVPQMGTPVPIPKNLVCKIAFYQKIFEASSNEKGAKNHYKCSCISPPNI